jgi:hypothetical protein
MHTTWTKVLPLLNASVMGLASLVEMFVNTLKKAWAHDQQLMVKGPQRGPSFLYAA